MTDSLVALDNPVLTSLTGPHARFAERHGQAVRYLADVAPFVALADEPDAGAWRDLAELAGSGTQVTVTAGTVMQPADWPVEFEIPGVQLVDNGIAAAPFDEAVLLGPADVPEMIDLVERTRPGPFLTRTIELGTYLGVRREGALVAMAGERMRPPGWTEISAVCTDPAFQGQGLATRLVLAVAAGIRARGEVPFLHTAAENTGAIRLYESLGFVVHRKPVFLVTRVP
ncbi:GNAT family N-acetyltransferase [Kutzneria sp. CA-103260]|uniref:GNAT family N-acetyltransferase n=1 Tax=Kutzneria sp. CA-103260 TaxID=2802641 RepID=UPI001BACB021|nr:GNAT family N-acetyltransferase [Kutzneria sp. CA-103260]